MGAVTPGIDTLLSEVLGAGRLPAVRGAPERVPEVGGVSAGHAALSDPSFNARPFARTLAGKDVPHTDPGQVAAPADASQAAPSTGGAASASEASLSDAARAIADALASVDAAAPPPTQPPLVTMVPHPDTMLLSALVDALAAALQGNVSRSGLFYESHLARWTAGAYALTDLADEPQMLPARLATALSAVRAARAAMPDDVTASPPASGAQPPAAAGATYSPHTAAIVHQQLQMLAKPAITLQIAPWPGAQATVRMTPAWPWHPGDGLRHRQKQSPPKPWSVDLHLRTRNLGPITAHLSVTAGRVGLRLDTDHWTAARLHVGVPQLRRRLASAGVETSDITVTEDAKQ